MTVDFDEVNVYSVDEGTVQVPVCVHLSASIEKNVTIQLLTFNGSASGSHLNSLFLLK